MSSLSLPSLETQTTVRTSSWQPNFEKNLDSFAELLACGIAKEALENLNRTLSDPYETRVTEENHFRFQVSLIITKTSDAKKILALTAGSKPVEPFHEWLNTFSIEKTALPLQTDEEDNGEQLENFSVARHGSFRNDDFYFSKKMSLVTQEVTQQLQKIFSDYQSRPEHRDLRFKVACYHIYDDASPSASGDLNHLAIHFWLQKERIPQPVEAPTGHSDSMARAEAPVKQHQTEQRRQSIHKGATIIAVSALCLFGLAGYSAAYLKDAWQKDDE